MGFLDFLGLFVKKLLFFIGGFIIAFPVAGVIMMTGGSYSNFQFNPNPIMAIIGIVVFIIGIAMMVYAAKLKDKE
jgi:divalent metal cation (Fe/Co/Zn/Cd) transporter